MLKVKKPVLFIVAGLVWLIAGVNILRIGVQAFFRTESLFLLLLGIAALVFVGFFFMFSAMVRRHKARILAYPQDKVSVFRFMDVKGYLIMAFMMELGIGLRSSGIMPTEFFAAFYSGLGSALSVAGIRFLAQAVTLCKNGRPAT